MKNLLKKICIFTLIAIFTVLFSSVPTKAAELNNSNNKHKVTFQECNVAFSNENISKTLKEWNVTKPGKYSKRVSENLVLNLVVTDDSSTNLPTLSTSSFITSSSYTKDITGYLYGSSYLGSNDKLFELWVTGTFVYDLTTVTPSYGYTTTKTYSGWSSSDKWNAHYPVTPTDARVLGGAHFYIAILGQEIQSMDPAIIIKCNQYGGYSIS